MEKREGQSHNTVKICVLVENTAGYGYRAEWGLSYYIEFLGKKMLFDAGMSSLTADNARQANINLSSIDIAILSHGHNDHTGGLPDLLKFIKRERVPVIAHPDIWTKKYVQLHEDAFEYCGIPFCREELESKGAQFQLTKEPVKITDSIMTTGEVPLNNKYEHVDSDLFIKVEGKYLPDPMKDDLSLIFNTGGGLVIVTGCAHRGVVNTIQHAQSLTGEKRILFVIGGFHLYHASEERIDWTIQTLIEMGVQKVSPCHCTGFYAMAQIYKGMPGQYQAVDAGTMIEI